MKKYLKLVSRDKKELCIIFHYFILGKPDNAQIGIRNKHDPLPPSIEGLYMSMANQSAKKARLTFKLELDELWINTGKRKDYYCIKFILIIILSGNNEKNSNDTNS